MSFNNNANTNVLPDSRSSHPVNSKFIAGMWWEAIYCANCGVDGGFVPAENTTFIFWLCNKCFESRGQLTNMYVMPDEIFWEKVKQEQLASYGHYLTHEEFAKVIDEDNSPLATLVKQRK